jgi:hypothetical protein
MKVKLLKKLRNGFFIEKRNNEYRLIKYIGGCYKWDWMKLDAVIRLRRCKILEEARWNYKVAKKTVNI